MQQPKITRALPFLAKIALNPALKSGMLALVTIVAISAPLASATAGNGERPVAEAFRATLPPVIFPQHPMQHGDEKLYNIQAYHGKGVVLNLWATWCSPCVAEMPALDRLRARLLPHGIEVLALSEDRKGIAKVVPFYEKTGIQHLPVLVDLRGAIMRQLRVSGLPTTIFISPAGMEIGRVIGIADWDSDESETFIRDLFKTK